MSAYNTFAQALNIAGAAHRKQVRKGKIDGREVAYLIHPMKVAYSVSAWTQGNYRAMAVGILHDVLEDTEGKERKYYEGKIKELGEDIYDSVVILTKKKSDSYSEYIQKIADSGNMTAVMSKIADIFANMNDTMLFEGKFNKKIINKAKTIHEKFFPLLEAHKDWDHSGIFFMRQALNGLKAQVDKYEDE